MESSNNNVSNVLKTVQQFNLKWNNHTNNILQVLSEQLACEALVDVTLSCQGQFLKAHKMILSACSPYFQELFQIHNVSHPIIILNGMRFVDVKHVVDFMYRGEVKVLETDLETILTVAEQLQVKGLCNVRTENTDEDCSNSGTPTTSAPPSGPRSRKRKRIEVANTGNLDQSFSNEKLHMETNETNTQIKKDVDLSGNINIDPLQISDIDGPNHIANVRSPPKNVKYYTNMKANNAQMPKAKKHIMTRSITTQKSSAESLKTYSRSTNRLQSDPKQIQTVSDSKQQNKQDTDWMRGTWHCVSETTSNNKEAPVKERVPRPPNAFMIFANEWRRTLAKENPKDSNKDISVRLGKQWKTLAADLKEEYYAAARKADEEHKIKYPGYFYSPKEARIRKYMCNNRGTYVRPSANTDGTIDAMILCKLVMPQDQNASNSGSNTTLDNNSNSGNVGKSNKDSEGNSPTSVSTNCPGEAFCKKEDSEGDSTTTPSPSLESSTVENNDHVT